MRLTHKSVVGVNVKDQWTMDNGQWTMVGKADPETWQIYILGGPVAAIWQKWILNHTRIRTLYINDFFVAGLGVGSRPPFFYTPLREAAEKSHFLSARCQATEKRIFFCGFANNIWIFYSLFLKISIMETCMYSNQINKLTKRKIGPTCLS